MNRATNLQSTEIVQETGIVVSCDVEGLKVRGGCGLYRASRAVSCLVEPTEGDIVLLATEQSGKAYVLAVLERHAVGKTRIVAEGDLEFKLAGGRFSVAARDGIGFTSSKDVKFVSAELNVNAVQGNFAFQRATAVGKYLQTEFERVKTFAISCDSVFQRWSQRVKNAYRRVEGTDQLRADQVDYRSRETMNLHGNNTVLTAKKLVKVDGEQIHVG
jgi:hypothetical protein